MSGTALCRRLGLGFLIPRHARIKRDRSKRVRNRQIIGWRELVQLPDLGVTNLRAKMDTGARTSALHVANIAPFVEDDGSDWVRFEIDHSAVGGASGTGRCKALLAGIRTVKSSNGGIERRPVIRTRVRIGDIEQLAEVTLTDRKDLLHPMLVGRTALRKRFLIDSGRSFLLGKGA